jgi:hypothetical protein
LRLQKCTGTYARQSSLIELDLAEMNDFKSHPGGGLPEGAPGCLPAHGGLPIYRVVHASFPKIFYKIFCQGFPGCSAPRCSLFGQGITTKNHTTISSLSNGVYPKKRDIRRESTRGHRKSGPTSLSLFSRIKYVYVVNGLS